MKLTNIETMKVFEYLVSISKLLLRYFLDFQTPREALPNFKYIKPLKDVKIMKISQCPNLKIKFNLFILPTGQLAAKQTFALNQTHLEYQLSVLRAPCSSVR